MERLTLPYKSSLISYLRFGQGARTAFCFHGYGEEAASYAFLESYAGADYTFFAIDLPFHGQTAWREGFDCTDNDLLYIMDQIVAIHHHGSTSVQDPQKQPVTLVGFSLGGRIALGLYQLIPSRGARLVLLAPDGLKVNFWYWLATQTWPGKRLFAFTMKKPNWFFLLLKGFNKLKLVNPSIFKFVNYYIGDPQARTLLYARWVTLRKLRPRLSSVRSSVRYHQTPVRLIYGKHDKIILPIRGEKFRKGIEDYCVLSVIPSGHQVLHEKHAQEILSALLL